MRRRRPTGPHASETPPSTFDVDPVLRPDFGTAEVPRRLPRGSGSLPPDIVAASHRARLMNAVASVVAEKGYAATSVSDLTNHAGISRTTFYALHADKEACFLSCHDQCARAHLTAILQAADSSPVLPEQVWRLLQAHLAIADTNPFFARAFIVEALVATPASQAAAEQARRALGDWLRAWFVRVRAAHPQVPARDDDVFSLVQEAVSGFVVSAIRQQRPLLPHAATVAQFVFNALGLPGWAAHVVSPRARFGAPVQ